MAKKGIVKLPKIVLLVLLVFLLTTVFSYAAHETVVCPTCDGTKTLPCPVPECYDGKVARTSDKGNTYYANCKRCGGDGRIICGECDGNGYIRQWVPNPPKNKK
jgi:DnaJ-class molecular chaperone